MNSEITDVLKQAQIATAEWVRDITRNEGSVNQYVKNLLNNKLEALVYRQAGLRKDIYSSGSEWTLDTINGRQTFLSEQIKEMAVDAARTWLKVNPFKVTDLDANTLKNLRSKYNNIFQRSLSDMVAEKARADAEQQVEALLSKSSVEFELETLENEVFELEKRKRELQREVPSDGLGT